MTFKSFCEEIGSVTHVTKIMSDFERGLMKAIKNNIPNANLHGCKQSIRRQLGLKGCLLFYNDIESFHDIVNLMMSLFAVPKEDILNVHRDVILKLWDSHKEEWKEHNMEDETEDFLAYYERTYLGKFNFFVTIIMHTFLLHNKNEFCL